MWGEGDGQQGAGKALMWTLGVSGEREAPATATLALFPCVFPLTLPAPVMLAL